MKSEKSGIIDVDGGFRGIYTVGILDCGVSPSSPGYKCSPSTI